MSNDILSQEEIDALLSGAADDSSSSSDGLEDADKDLLGEIGNICMGSAATTLSILISQPVSITTPRVSVITLGELKETFQVPNLCIEVRFVTGLDGANLLVLKVPDAGVIADLMMGGTGQKKVDKLTEIEMSAVAEAMNQMIGTAATSMATMFNKEVNISPPDAHVWDNKSQKLSNVIDDSDSVVQVSFRLTIGTMVDSEIMQLLPLNTAKEIIEAMTAGFKGTPAQPKAMETPTAAPVVQATPAAKAVSAVEAPSASIDAVPAGGYQPAPYAESEDIQVHKAQFTPLEDASPGKPPRNIDLILDVPIEVSVILGRSNKTIKEILELNNGSLIELDRFVEEPVDILVNGKMVAQGEVVVVNENFGVRITSIVSNVERVKGLKK